MRRVNLVYAHPSPQRSTINRVLKAAAEAVDGVEVRDLYELYPDLFIDVDAEKAALIAADILVFHFPIYWFSAPAILKEWQDTVLTNGFAFGPGGTVLKGKGFAAATTTGGSVTSYAENRPHGAPIQSYLVPFEQTARFCGMTVLDPFVVHGVGTMSAVDVAAASDSYRDFLTHMVESSA